MTMPLYSNSITKKQQYEEKNKDALDTKLSKTRYSLLPWKQLEEVARIFHVGAEKYTDYGWQQLDKEHYLDAISRHFVAFMSGEYIDEDDKMSHLSHIIANALILRWHHERKD